MFVGSNNFEGRRKRWRILFFVDVVLVVFVFFFVVLVLDKVCGLVGLGCGLVLC